MQKAADSTDGCMYAILGLDDAVVEKICAETEGVVLPVNYNCKGQLVIAGERAAAEARGYEIVCAVSKRVPRIYYYGGKAVDRKLWIGD